MPSPFEAALDNSGRITHFTPAGHPGVDISPGHISGVLDGGERVMIGDQEYELTETGSLVHPDVDITDEVVLGYGVRIDRGTVFDAERDAEEGTPDTIFVADHARVKGTEVKEGVIIGGHALVLARSIGHHTVVGSYVRVGIGTDIGPNVKILKTAKIDVESQIAERVVIGENARLGFNTRVGEGATIGARARIGTFSGAGPRGVNQDGPLIRPGVNVPASARIAE